MTTIAGCPSGSVFLSKMANQPRKAMLQGAKSLLSHATWRLLPILANL
jgi:hypothetical protein